MVVIYVEVMGIEICGIEVTDVVAMNLVLIDTNSGGRGGIDSSSSGSYGRIYIVSLWNNASGLIETERFLLRWKAVWWR